MFIDPEFRAGDTARHCLRNLQKSLLREVMEDLNGHAFSWNKVSIDFYLSLGAKQMDWNVFHLTGEEIERLANE